ncbi:alpha/beta-hydrolase [Bimuria novae-zelandiae CBS 107.79]|uniref:Alpha/beta-hydrolase n=1 Tax=Bimuria novae-zelandiae CBS 107.79 TaxID=1447943 RepID=A0A6A5VQ47_9PLEO|nr:alpha/beta-hydrolase [Bimuria novae-zelandiae CBS 107.79]
MYCAKNGNTVVRNPFSFNENAHMLYVDQPNQVGFSYEEIVDGVFDALGGGSGAISTTDLETSLTKIKGKFPSHDLGATVGTSTMAAKNMWYFLQVFFTDFGVPYGETLASYTIRTNQTFPVQPGAILRRITVPSLYNKTTYDAVVATATAPNGCLDQVRQCRAAKALDDPSDEGLDPRVGEICYYATLTCQNDVLLPYFTEPKNPRSGYDIGLPQAQPWPPKYAASYLNNPRIRASLGIPGGLNYLLFATVVNNAFIMTDDPVRDGRADLTYLLNAGTRVAMIYGDGDWQCNWLGAENLTLSLPWTPTSCRRFNSSGYVELNLNSYNTGAATAVTRQHILLSFTRGF